MHPLHAMQPRQLPPLRRLRAEQAVRRGWLGWEGPAGRWRRRRGCCRGAPLARQPASAEGAGSAVAAAMAPVRH